MALPNINPTTTNSWKALQQHFQEIQSAHMVDLFAEDASRAHRFAIEWNDFYVDFSKNRINDATVELLMNLAKECRLEEAIKNYFEGIPINVTEGRAVLHTALREQKKCDRYY